MRLRACSAPLLLLLLPACATMDPSLGEREDASPRFANLQRAAQYPWTDDGHCVVREASNEWPALAERCFHVLDHDRVKFRDVTGKCAVASTGAAAATMAVGLCVFASPAVVAGAVIVIGTVVVAVAIKEGLDAYERSASRERAKRKAQARPSSEQEPLADREPTPRGLGRDWFPQTRQSPWTRVIAVRSASPSRCRIEAVMTRTMSAPIKFRTTASPAGMCSSMASNSTRCNSPRARCGTSKRTILKNSRRAHKGSLSG